jgi:hypothetical protein
MYSSNHLTRQRDKEQTREQGNSRYRDEKGWKQETRNKKQETRDNRNRINNATGMCHMTITSATRTTWWHRGRASANANANAM